MVYIAIHLIIQAALIVRVLLRPHRQPTARIAWITIIVSLPAAGIGAYLLFGETNIGRRRAQRVKRITSRLAGMVPHAEPPDFPHPYTHLFQVGKTVNGFDPVGGNRACLLRDSNAAIDAMVADIDAARDHVHLTFYIWLPDNNGSKVAMALSRAAARGVTCRALADDLGSRPIIDSEQWRLMRESGVHLAKALPIGNPLLRPLKGRIDLRNHRKIVVIDNAVTYCGSQNCADPEFRIKAKYAPWVDVMVRFEGPVARQNQYLFATDWEAETGEALDDLLRQPSPRARGGLVAQVVGTGPTVRYSAMPEIFETLMYAARRELVVTTPYYVPDEAMQAALCASARRGVKTTIVFPMRNDSRIVAAASRSYYAELLAAGVRIFEYQGGLLHSKTLTLDGEVALIGSANLDRRSFELNYENNILFYDPSLATELHHRQQDYIEGSRRVSRELIAQWPWYQQLWNNAVAMMGPVL